MSNGRRKLTRRAGPCLPELTSAWAGSLIHFTSGTRRLVAGSPAATSDRGPFEHDYVLMTDDGNDEGTYEGPEVEVWNHLWSGIDMAVDELAVLDDEDRKFCEGLAKIIASGQAELVLQTGSIAAPFVKVNEELLSDLPWLRHAVEIEIAVRGISRSEKALKRYLRLRPTVVQRPLPARAQRYIQDVVETFAFAFDAACIALCRASLEQLLREALVGRGVYTEKRLRRERPTAGALLANAKREGLLHKSYAAAERVVSKGDTVMHQHLYEERVLEQLAFDSVTELLQVVSELLEGT